MNKFIYVLLTTFFLAACTQQNEPYIGKQHYEGGFWYIVNLTGEIEITNYTGTETNIRIPDRIENRSVGWIRGRERKIISAFGSIIVSDGAFENKNLTGVILPDTIRNINEGAFANNNITNIQLPDNLAWIGESAFMNNRLTGVVIPDNVWLRIEPQAFENNQITEVIFDSNIEHIGYSAFRNNKITSLSIPSGITIGRGAFKDNNITSINVGENVRLYSSVNSPAFELGFDEFFLENGNRAGIYVYENGEWQFISGLED